jgi:hypothetical protein
VLKRNWDLKRDSKYFSFLSVLISLHFWFFLLFLHSPQYLVQSFHVLHADGHSSFSPVTRDLVVGGTWWTTRLTERLIWAGPRLGVVGPGWQAWSSPWRSRPNSSFVCLSSCSLLACLTGWSWQGSGGASRGRTWTRRHWCFDWTLDTGSGTKETNFTFTFSPVTYLVIGGTWWTTRLTERSIGAGVGNT